MSVIQSTVLNDVEWDDRPKQATLDGSVPVSQPGSCLAIDGDLGLRCQACGEPARVQVLTGYSKAGPLYKRLCLHCEPYEMRGSYQPGSERHLRAWLLIAMVAAALLAVGFFGDWLIPPRHSGFGWYQGWGVILGLASALFGLLLGADLVALAGGLLFCAAVSADWFGLTQGEGIGRTQEYMILAGEACLVIALLFWRRSVWFQKRQTPSTAKASITFSSGLATPR